MAGGVRLDMPPILLESTQSPLLENVQVKDMLCRLRPGTVLPGWTGAVDGSRILSGAGDVVRLGDFWQGDETLLIIVHAVHATGPTTRTFKIVGNVITELTGVTFTGSPSQPFDYCTLPTQELYCFSNGVDKLTTYPGTGTTLTQIAAAYPGRYLASFAGRSLLGYVEDSGSKSRRIRWPRRDVVTDWTGTGSGFLDLDRSPGAIQNLKTLQNVCVAYQSDAISFITETGSLSPVFKVEVFKKGQGLLLPFSLQDMGGVHVGVFSDDIYIMDTGGMQAIGNGIIRDVQRSLDMATRRQGWSVYNPTLKEYTFGFCTTGRHETANVGFPDVAWTYNFATQSWFKQLISARSAVMYSRQTALTIAGLIGTIAQQTWRPNESALSSGFPLPLLGRNGGKITTWDPSTGSDEGAAYTWKLRTKSDDFDAPATEKIVRRIRLRFERASSGSITVRDSINDGSTFAQTKYLTYSGSGGFADVFVDIYQSGLRHLIELEGQTDFPLLEVGIEYSLGAWAR